MRRALRFLPTLAFAGAVAALIYIGASLYSRATNDLAWARRDAFAQSVQAGVRLVPAQNVAGALRQELAAERARRQLDRRFAIVAFGATLLLAIGALVQVATNSNRRIGVPESAAA